MPRLLPAGESLELDGLNAISSSAGLALEMTGQERAVAAARFCR
jgi:hypothetical protein